MNNKTVSISEFGYIGCGYNYKDHKTYTSKNIDYSAFKELEEFHKNSSKPIFTYVPNCKGKVLQAINNYVGVIQTSNLSLEILPKTYQNEDEKEARSLLNKMLLIIYDIPTEISGTEANLDNLEGMNIFEVFIKIFIKSVDELIKKGVKSDYILQNGNLLHLKGKLKFSDNIRYNLAHKERFYVEYDEYLPNRVENRLIKSCIKYLLNHSQDSTNQKLLREQLFFFDDVFYSTNIKYDLSCIKELPRGMEYYNVPLKFAKIFLENKSFTPTVGNNNVFSFLFPMDKIFERYVEVLLRHMALDVQTRFRGNYFLVNDKEKADKQIGLEPDYKFEYKNQTIIADAKWKLYDNEDKSHKDSMLKREDIFQVYSYMHYFNSYIGYIFTPQIYEKTSSKIVYKFQQKTGEPKRELRVVFVNLRNKSLQL